MLRDSGLASYTTPVWAPPSLLFLLPGGLINPPQRWAAVMGSREPLLLSSQGWLAGAQEEMEHSLQSVNCSRANHLSAGSEGKDAEFRARTINNAQSCAPEENKAAHVLFLGKTKMFRVLQSWGQ